MVKNIISDLRQNYNNMSIFSNFSGNPIGENVEEGVEVFTGRGSSTANRVSVPKVLITAVTDKSNQKKVVDAILNSAKTTETGQIGDGKIFISEISDVIRVRTGDTGKKAL